MDTPHHARPLKGGGRRDTQQPMRKVNGESRHGNEQTLFMQMYVCDRS